jgi:hypothetical protein
MIPLISALFLASSIFCSVNAMETSAPTINLNNLSPHFGIEYLLNMDMGYCSEETKFGDIKIYKSGTQIPRYNRIYVSSLSHSLTQNIKTLEKFMGTAPFNWWVEKSQKDIAQYLDLNGFVKKLSAEHAMIAELKQLVDTTSKNTIAVKKVATDQDLEEWIATSAAGCKIPIEVQRTFIQSLKDNAASNTLYFYTAYVYDVGLNKIPVATSIVIKHDDTKVISLHMASIIEPNHEYCTAISIQPLLDAQKEGFTHAILLSTDVSHLLYQKLGFKDYATYFIYELPASSYCNII